MGAATEFTVEGQSILVAGGSKGLGREIAALLVRRGASVIILARNIDQLEHTRDCLIPLRKRSDQTVVVKSVDLTNASEVQEFIASLSQSQLPSSLFCVAGGTSDEIGFFADITTDQIFSCFQKNYFSSAYVTHALLQRWLDNPPDPAIIRHIVFTNSTAALVAIPGYVAYTPTKTALRALADTLRQEILLYEPQQTIRVHSSFPGSIITDSFLDEQRHKPALCKQLEGSEPSDRSMMKNCTTPSRAATAIIAGIDRGDFCIYLDFQTRLLLNNMRGPSPANSASFFFFFFWDWVLSVVASVVWPFVRRSWDGKTRRYGLKHNKL